MELPATPTIIVDENTVRANLKRMAEYAQLHDLALRPHTKTHKSKLVGKMQLEYGAIGLTVAKVGEAEVMSDICNDILMAYPPVDPIRCERLARLAGDVTLRVGLDSLLSAENLSKAANQIGTNVSILVDYDIGYGRTGVQSIDDAAQLGKSISNLHGLQLDGIMLYSGHISGDQERQQQMMAELSANVSQLLDVWQKLGFSNEIISSGSTPSAFYSHLVPFVNEIRPGTYVYNDMNTVRGGYCDESACAARIHATVISNTVPGQVVLDAGSKTLTSDLCGPAPESGYGFVVEFPDAKIVRLTEEHAQVDVKNCKIVPELGQRVTIIPNHICVCINMQNSFWWQDGSSLSDHPVDSRGLLI